MYPPIIPSPRFFDVDRCAYQVFSSLPLLFGLWEFLWMTETSLEICCLPSSFMIILQGRFPRQHFVLTVSDRATEMKDRALQHGRRRSKCIPTTQHLYNGNDYPANDEHSVHVLAHDPGRMIFDFPTVKQEIPQEGNKLKIHT